MKLCLSVNIFLTILIATSDAYTTSIGGSSFVVRNQHVSSGTGGSMRRDNMRITNNKNNNINRASTLVMYEPGTDDGGNKKKKGDASSINAWTALANTEKWISDTLSDANASANSVAGGDSNSNPYKRKEVSYVCEPSDDAALIIAGIFRRLRESRESGEVHGETQEGLLLENEGTAYQPRTVRQTQVVVIPSSITLTNSFITFDNLLNAINQARRSARDYVTDISLEKLDEKIGGGGAENEIGERDWVVSVNCAHLHPKFGEKTPEQILEEMKEEDENGEVDLNLESYKERRLMARRSPYPSIVIEVMSSPPPDFGGAQLKAPPMTSQQPGAKTDGSNSDPDDKVTSEDIQKLEALFGMSAATKADEKKKRSDDAFYEAIGEVTGIQSISVVTPTILAQNWIDKHDDKFDSKTSAFTATDIKHVDSAYEFVFQNLAMQSSKFKIEDNDANNTNDDASATTVAGEISEKIQEEVSKSTGIRQYLVMPHFLSSSATSFVKFASEVRNIISTIPELADAVQVSTFHPEQVDKTKRSPVPIFVIEWQGL